MTALDTTRALRSLDGLSVGDAFGQLFFAHRSFPQDIQHILSHAILPPGPWRWTDDTHMALSIVDVLDTHGEINQDTLGQSFARRFTEEPWRGYAGGAVSLLTRIGEGADWRTISPALFGGGSFGNGAAMRAAPIGGFFHNNPTRAASEAQRSAVITHAHPEGQAGAIAVAVAASIAASPTPPVGSEFLRAVLDFVPAGLTRQRIVLAMDLASDEFAEAKKRLGTGEQVSAQDTVPFCLWSAAHHLDNFEDALWWTARGLGDCDTTCAIVGGIVSLSAREIPAEWLARREALPSPRMGVVQ